MSDNYVKLFTSLTDLHREADDLVYVHYFTLLEEKSHFLLNIMQNFDNKSLEEQNQFILKYYTQILTYRLFTESESSRATVQRLFTNEKFLKVLFDNLGKINLDNFQKLFLNRLAYDYMSTHSSKENDNVYNLYLQITGYINSNLTIKLSSKLAINEAKLLAVISNSIDKPEIRVHRINRFLVNCDNPILDTQAMINIMFFLYDKFTDPIIYTLLEKEDCCKDPECLPQYHRLMKAIVSILLSIPTEKMVKVLTSYGYILNSYNGIPRIRLKEIQDARLRNAISIVEQDPLIKEIY